MLFNSYEFVFVFLPVFVAGHYVISYMVSRYYKSHREDTAQTVLKRSDLCNTADQNEKALKPGCYKNAVELYCVILSLVVFSFFGIKVLGVLAISLVWNYIFIRLLDSRKDMEEPESFVQNSSTRALQKDKTLLILGICGNIALLIFFKYAGFLADIVNSLTGRSVTVSILLPIAISFYTFSQISLLVDIYRGEVYELCLFDYLFYITFFPKILQGPIVRYSDMKSYLDNALVKRWDTQKFMQALMLFILGLSKKVIIADTLAVAVDYGYNSLLTLSPMDAVITAVCYSFQIYFDFSGYCDMGRGICKMVGMDLPVNFESPYKARNIDDFWKRWHMSLTAFFTRYVYIPLGGNRKGALRTYLNFMVIFTLSGLWHGAGLTFIVWGAMHGALYVITRAVKNHDKNKPNTRVNTNIDTKTKVNSKIDTNARVNTKVKMNTSTDTKTVVEAGRTENNENRSITRSKTSTHQSPIYVLRHIVAVTLTFIFVTIAWVFFRAQSLGDAINLLRVVTGIDYKGASPLHISPDLIKCFQIDELWYIFKITPIANMTWGPAVCMWIIILISAYLAFISPNAAHLADKHKVNVKGAVLLAILFVWSVIKFANVSTYIYLGF